MWGVGPYAALICRIHELIGECVSCLCVCFVLVHVCHHCPTEWLHVGVKNLEVCVLVLWVFSEAVEV